MNSSKRKKKSIISGSNRERAWEENHSWRKNMKKQASKNMSQWRGEKKKKIMIMINRRQTQLSTPKNLLIVETVDDGGASCNPLWRVETEQPWKKVSVLCSGAMAEVEVEVGVKFCKVQTRQKLFCKWLQFPYKFHVLCQLILPPSAQIKVAPRLLFF